MFGGGNGFEQRAELDAVLQPDLRGGNFPGGRRHAGGLAQFVARKNRLQRHRRLRALVRGDVGVQRGNDFVRARRLVFQIGNHLEHFRHDGHARLEAFGLAKIREQAVLQRSFLRLINTGSVFFSRHDEMAVLFHFAPRGFPPFLPVVADDVGHEHVLDLIRRRLAAKAVQNDFDQIQVMRRQMADGVEVRRLAREDVVFRHRLERFGGEGQIHRMPRLAGKINREPREHRVHRFDAAEAPAPVRAAAGLGQLGQGCNVLALDFSRRRQFFEFFFHKFLISRPANRISLLK